MTGTRTSLFNRGVEAVRAAFGIDGVYLCPICGQQFSREALKEGQLTLEHVPPRALGGRGIILTCKACNNLAGYTVDAAISKRADMDRFGEVLLLDEVGEAGRATVQVGEAPPVKVDILSDGTTRTLRVLTKFNNPQAVAHLAAELRSHSDSGKIGGLVMSITAISSYDQKLARAGDLRVAFLAATALFGFKFAFSPQIKPVRDQIKDPRADILPPWWRVDLGKRLDDCLILSLDDGIILVAFGGRTVLMPWPSHGFDHYREVVNRWSDEGRFNYRGQSYNWPRSLHAALDHPEER